MDKINSNFSGQNIYVGMDIHKASWNLGIHLNDMFVKNVHQKPDPHIMAKYLQQHYPGAHYKAVYEAGKFGFWIQRQLTALGIECLVVNPADSLLLRHSFFNNQGKGLSVKLNKKTKEEL